ncbi:MAG: DUF1501 domain-containing protein [Planctomycetaceae bacterium]|nr:DUF1501 domain-containing protein [Planctomycetaceae bacterium]
MNRFELSRREVLRFGALALGGLSVADLRHCRAAGSSSGMARHCIFVFLNGGPAQLDTFDLKPEAPGGIRGPYRPIETSVPGVQITEKLPKLARLAHHFAILRSATHPLSAHNSSAAYALSGHSPGSDANIRPTPADHPTYGSVVARTLPALHGMPPFVLTPTFLFDMGFPTPSAGGGWMGPRYDPFPVVRNRMMAPSPRWDGVLPVPEGMKLPEDLSLERLRSRARLLNQIDDSFSQAQARAELATLDAHQRDAMNLVLSHETRAAFDVSRESPAMHDRYGRTEMGQALLLSRRLIEAGVRFVTANAVSNPENTKLSAFQIWDTHFDHFRLYDHYLMPELDQALSALLSDLDERGLLDETLVIVMGEMGRTPQINSNPGGGRDHWGKAYSVLWSGGGIVGGQTVGATDRHAAEVKDLPARPDDIAATLYEALGIPHDLILKDATDRPHRITDGTPIRPLLG